MIPGHASHSALGAFHPTPIASSRTSAQPTALRRRRRRAGIRRRVRCRSRRRTKKTPERSTPPSERGGVLVGRLIVVRLDVALFYAVLRLPRRRQTVCRLGGCPAGCDRCGVEGTQRTVAWMPGDHDRCLSTLGSGRFDRCCSMPMRTSHQHRRADVWGESGIMTGVSQRW